MCYRGCWAGYLEGNDDEGAWICYSWKDSLKYKADGGDWSDNDSAFFGEWVGGLMDISDCYRADDRDHRFEMNAVVYDVR